MPVKLREEKCNCLAAQSNQTLRSPSSNGEIEHICTDTKLPMDYLKNSIRFLKNFRRKTIPYIEVKCNTVLLYLFLRAAPLNLRSNKYFHK